MSIRVCHVISGLRVGGAEVSLLRLIEHLEADRFANRVVALVNGELVDPVREAGAEVVTVGVKLSRPDRLARLFTAVQGWRADVVHGWMYHGNLAALLVRGGAPLVWGIRHSPDSLADLTIHTRATVRVGAIFSPVPDRIIFNSHHAAQKHAEMGYRAESREVIANGFDPLTYYPDPEDRLEVRAELGISPSATVIGMVARAHPIKDHGLFLTAAERLITAGADVHFVMAGSGVSLDREPFRETAVRVGSDRLHTLGRRGDIPRLLRALDILTLTSRAEGMPNVLGEALATGVPCVSTDVGDARVLIAGAGVVIPVGNEDALVAAWQRLIGMGAESLHGLGLEGRRHITKRFTIDRMTAQYTAMYETLATGRRVIS